MPEQLGVDKIIKLLDAGFGFTLKAMKAYEDKRITLMEGIGLFSPTTALIGTIKTWPEVQAQLDDLTEEENEQIETHSMNEFNIPKEKVKVFIVHCLMQVISLNALINEFKHINDPVV